MKLAALIPLTLFAFASFAQEPVLLNDFTTSGASTFDFDPEIEGIVMKPSPGVDGADRLFFVANDGTNGEELWRSDGTEVGTQLVKDIRPGEDDSSINFLEAIGNTVYFAATDGEHGYELWKSQGTAASTQMVVDLNEGSGSGISTGNGRHVYFNDILYFSGSKDKGTELYRTDGTAQGTSLVKDINPNVTGSGLPFSSLPSHMTAAQDFIYFVANDGEHGNELWRTDGTAAGTVLVKDISEGISSTNFYQMKAFENTLIFTADDGVNGRELWISLGTAESTYMIADITGGEAGSDINLLEVVGNFMYFTVRESVFRRLWKTNGLQGNAEIVLDENGNDINTRAFIPYQNQLFLQGNFRLWKVDGTDEGTEQISDVPIAGEFAIMNDTLYFEGAETVGGRELWKTDGTTEGTSLVKKVTTASNRNIEYLTAVNAASLNRLFFIASTHEFGRELWTSDGTEEGTFMLVDSKPGEEDGFRTYEDVNFHAVGGRLMFAGFDEVNGRELWKSDGTTEGTALVKDINSQSEDIRLYSNPISFQNQTFFVTDEGVWQTDGTSENTSLLQESEATFGLQVFNDQLLYTAPAPGTSRTIWTSDGTDEGSQPLLDSAEAAGLTILFQRKQPQINGSLFFAGRTSELGWELYKTDGTAESTVLIKDINPGNADGAYILEEDDYFILNNTLYFRAGTSLQGSELWKTDGTETGTVPVTDINPLGNSIPRHFLEIDGTVFFSADDGTSGRELWKTNGTTDGTVLVKDIFPGDEDDDGIPSNVEFVNYQGTLFFGASTGEFGTELWKSDGTEQGTVMVKDIYPANNNFVRSSNPRGLTVYNDLLLFIATDSTGRKIWRSDGTEAGTQLLIDIEANSGFINANGTLFFTASDEEHGLELWRTDGTPEGTQLVQDIFTGPNDSSPSLLGFINETLFFTALDESNGRELWALSPFRLQTQVSASSSTVCSAEDSITFTVSTTNVSANLTYQWYVNDQAVADQNSQTFKTNGFSDGDKVKVLVKAGKDIWALNDSVLSEPFAIDFSTLSPKITVSGNALTASEGSFYRWFYEGILLSDTTRSITVQESGSYQVEISNASGCIARSEEVEVIVCTAEVPNVQVDGTSLIVSEAGTYRWFLNGELLSETSQSIEASESGSYSVEVTDATGCVATSEEVEVLICTADTPVIQVNGATLKVDLEGNYRWFFER
ncbi:ELWxxDGT repeat protein [Catalinimonas alkaloidigena]|uniref:ELWxxDGT repeat protein n=1 Tax=Catalinimonas alkaloidigena TaxID=1075417 RepID=UPI002405AE7D|nr:ELWxxDGT repeat protein [Catalinimonas alkaloidigena]MDF9794768.1 ELWxxDGT repeat protein [Catalinimonas alkaloidigena]